MTLPAKTRLRSSDGSSVGIALATAIATAPAVAHPTAGRSDEVVVVTVVPSAEQPVKMRVHEVV